MDYTLVIGLLVVLVVGFFAYQWMNKRSIAKFMGSKSPAPAPTAGDPTTAGSTSTQLPKEEAYPAIPGQTQAEALTKEAIQRREPSSQQGPVTAAGDAPAQFDEHLRHPEQLFHQPSGSSLTPTLQVSDLGSGRAAAQSTPLGPAPTGAGQQGFSPEMAQNGGAFIGNSVFAFDGMEPVGFTSF
jgi:hypothetical protein